MIKIIASMFVSTVKQTQIFFYLRRTLTVFIRMLYFIYKEDSKRDALLWRWDCISARCCGQYSYEHFIE